MREQFTFEAGPFEAYEIGEEEVSEFRREYIRWVQQSLNKILRLRLMVDGIMGAKTRSAIRSFQQRWGLKVDGIVGPRTQAAILNTLGVISRYTGEPVNLPPIEVRGRVR